MATLLNSDHVVFHDVVVPVTTVGRAKLFRYPDSVVATDYRTSSNDMTEVEFTRG